MTDPLFMHNATGDVYYYHNDHLGAPQQMVDSVGNIVWQASYSAFGKANITVDSVENNLRFPGQYFDAENGLHQNFRRDYDPMFGRYVQADPIGLVGGINNYVYAEGNPLNLFAPEGLTGRGASDANKIGAKSPHRGTNTGVFGCLIGCLGYTQGDSETQA